MRIPLSASTRVLFEASRPFPLGFRWVSAMTMHSVAFFSYASADSDVTAPPPGTKHYTGDELAFLEVGSAPD